MKRALPSVVFSVWALGFDRPSLWDFYPGDYISKVCSFFFLFCWAVVCATAWLSIHKLKDMFQYECSSYNLNIVSPKFAITWIYTFVYKFSNWWPHTSGDQESEFYDVEKTMKFAANKQVDNLYYGFLNFDLGTWKILLTAMISPSKIFWSWRTCFPHLGSEPTFFFYFYPYNYVWVFYWGWVEVKGQPMGVGFFFPSCSWGLISGCQSWQQVSLPTKLSCWPKESTIFFPGQDTYFKFLLFILTESNHDLSFKFSSLPVLDGKEKKTTQFGKRVSE